jgi:glycosyltransferase involved in cell wall biosynthesis
VDNHFSIVVPVYSEPKGSNHDRAEKVKRLVKSIENQSYTNWRLILVDDGCVDGETPQYLDELEEGNPNIRVIHQPNQQRVIARNQGMRFARMLNPDTWICWADTDDQYTLDYLWVANESINAYPDFSVFFFGALIRWPEMLHIRHAFEPLEEGDGHEWFKSGHINTGSFIFRAALLDDPDLWLPETDNCYEFAALSKFDLKLPDNEPHVDNPTGAFSDGVRRHGLSIGNPWGDDFLQCYKLTRHNKVKSMDIPIYIIYPRGTEE